jgi:hypothetical protein
MKDKHDGICTVHSIGPIDYGYDTDYKRAIGVYWNDVSIMFAFCGYWIGCEW